ncbi:Hsp20/alpha crystallin family protein [Candidatus Parcubacteria bacterium]|nr:Hsp20/alpha crystallin family protein [Candidatus Parcubacteria bacterium]
MPIIPWRPFWDIERWFEEEWPEFSLPKIRTPRMDIYETDNKVVAEVELPGVDPKNINVTVKDNLLKVEAKSEEKKEVKERGYYRKEIGTRYFKRVVPLPAEVLGDKAEAEYSDGILKISIPKAPPKKEKEKTIKIKVKKE